MIAWQRNKNFRQHKNNYYTQGNNTFAEFFHCNSQLEVEITAHLLLTPLLNHFSDIKKRSGISQR